jgi:hypothetical protein
MHAQGPGEPGHRGQSSRFLGFCGIESTHPKRNLLACNLGQKRKPYKLAIVYVSHLVRCMADVRSGTKS